MNKMRTPTLFLVFLLSFAFQSVVFAENDTLKNSVEAAENWLKLLDGDKYSESWDTGSLTFRLTIPKGHWISMMEKIRKPFGNVSSRKILDQRPAKDPEGLPRGDYMVIVFQTTFSHNKEGRELVTLVQESDGKWRVLTYQVQ